MSAARKLSSAMMSWQTVLSHWKKLPRLCAVALFFILVSLPLVSHVSGWEPKTGYKENRILAIPPTRPSSKAEWVKFFSASDAWLNDHFGLRQSLVALNNQFRYLLLGEVSSPYLTPGHNGFIFFNFGAPTDPFGTFRFLCGFGVSPESLQQKANRLAEFVQSVGSLHPVSSFLIVPTKSTVYPENLPDWLQGQCHKSNPPVPAILAMLSVKPEILKRIDYPIEKMNELKASVELYPKFGFHWEGEGARRVAEYLAGTKLGMAKLAELPRQPELSPSDLQQFLPGVPLNNPVVLGNYAAVGIDKCWGGGCFPELSGISDKLGDTTRYRHNKFSGPRLLIVSDSFGQGIAGYFSEYFGEVWHINTNNVPLLSVDEMQRLKAVAFKTYAPDRVLYIMNDFSIGYPYSLSLRETTTLLFNMN